MPPRPAVFRRDSTALRQREQSWPCTPAPDHASTKRFYQQWRLAFERSATPGLFVARITCARALRHSDLFVGRADFLRKGARDGSIEERRAHHLAGGTCLGETRWLPYSRKSRVAPAAYFRGLPNLPEFQKLWRAPPLHAMCAHWFRSRGAPAGALSLPTHTPGRVRANFGFLVSHSDGGRSSRNCCVLAAEDHRSAQARVGPCNLS